MVTATFTSKKPPMMVVLPYFLHNILIFRVLTLSVISSTPGESLTLDLRKNWLFSYSFSVRFLSQPEVVGALGWKWTDMIWALSTVNFFCVLVSNVRGQMSLWTVPQPRNPQLCACFHITGWSQALPCYRHMFLHLPVSGWSGLYLQWRGMEGHFSHWQLFPNDQLVMLKEGASLPS